MLDTAIEPTTHSSPEVRSALERFERGEISIGRLTKLLGITYWDIYPFLRQAGIRPPNPSDLDRDEMMTVEPNPS